MKNFLAFDFGADSGRAIVGTLSDGIVKLDEVHRFQNRQVSVDGHLHWDIPYLFGELKKGIALALKRGPISSMAVDSWGVDFALVGKDGRLVEAPYTYHDRRTEGMMQKVFGRVSREEIYAATGIQFMQINSLYQLYSRHSEDPASLNETTVLFIADLFNFLLTGKRCSEYSIASTSQLMNVRTKNWEGEIFERLQIPESIMAPVIEPGCLIGPLLNDITLELDIKEKINVVTVGCHDTASAVAAVPSVGSDWGFLSSGTWSIIGRELVAPNVSKAALDADFTNEGGVAGRIRFVRNVMGMWLLQELRRNWKGRGKNYSYDDLSGIASTSSNFISIIDPEDYSYLSPTDMGTAIADYCRKTNQPEPRSDGETVYCVLRSLATKYASTLSKVEEITGDRISKLHIVGGGSRNEMLNQMTADMCGIDVLAGPVEATALGNVMVQAMANGEVESIEEIRGIVGRSFPVKVFHPQTAGVKRNRV